MAQAEAELDTASTPKPSMVKRLIFGVVLAITLGAGGFYAVWSGLILGHDHKSEEPAHAPTVEALPDIAFLAIEPILVPLGPGRRALRFRGQVEVNRAYLDDVETLMPRIVDVLNGFLRAVEPSELEDPGALTRLRAQMLRRVQVVTGEGRVRDLLIMEFVFN